MCGIAGILGNASCPDALERMIDALRHRGPDGNGRWASKDGGVRMGHTRLAILDLSDAATQPMTDGPITLVYNGELYNFGALRRELQRVGWQFGSSGDSEVVLKAYRQWGHGALARLEGMFAIAVYDSSTQKLTLARDRCGQKPLYYGWDGQTFLFASESEALLSTGLIQRRTNIEGLQDYLAYGYSLGPHTMIEGVRKLKPGERVTFDASQRKVETDRYWSIPMRPSISNGDLASDWQGELRTLLQSAIKRHLVSDVPVGVLLSGGVDSSLLSALAAEASDAPIKTFTATFPGSGRFDESSYARLVADYFGTEHHEVEVPAPTPSVMEKIAGQLDDPIADHAIIPMYLLSQEVRKHATVAIGGDGGDELFGGYPHHLIAAKQQSLRRFLPSTLRSAAASIGRRLPMGARGRNHLLGLAGDLPNAIAHFNLYFDSKARSKLLNCTHSQAPEKRRAAMVPEGDDAISAAMVADFRTTLPEGYLAKIDRASMLASLEVRAPFLDDPLVDYAWRHLSVREKFADGQGKAPLRALAKQVLPSSLDLNRKQGLTMPLEQWSEGTWGNFIKDILTDPQQTTFSHKQINRMISLQSKGYRNGNRLHALAMFELWRQQHGVSV